jgi:hypothetical protein
LEGVEMANDKKGENQLSTTRMERVKLTAEDSLKRMQAFGKRKAALVVAVRKVKIVEAGT